MATLRAQLLQHTHNAEKLAKKLDGPCQENAGGSEALESAKELILKLSACVTDAAALAATGAGDAHAFKVFNLPSWPQARVAAWLKRQKVDVKTLSKESAWQHAVVTVTTEEQKKAAMATLSQCRIQGAQLRCAEIVSTGEDRVQSSAAHTSNTEVCETGQQSHKRAADAIAEHKTLATRGHRVRERDPDYPDDAKFFDIREQMSPLWKTPYPEQLQQKYQHLVEILHDTAWTLARSIGDGQRPQWLREVLSPGKGNRCLCSPLLGIVRSPAQQAYRNNVEFTIGFTPDRRPIVGYLYGRYTEGFTAVADPRNLPNISPVGKGYAALLTSFLRSEACKLPAWDKADNDVQTAKRGFWRLLSVREGRQQTYFSDSSLDSMPGTHKLEELDVGRFVVPQADTLKEASNGFGNSGRCIPHLDTAALESVPAEGAEAPHPDEVALLLQVNPDYTTAAAMQNELQAFSDYLAANRPPHLPPPSLFVVQEHAHSGNGASPDAKMYPAPGFENAADTFSDTLCNVSFKLSPTSFFQINSAAAALLYKLAGDWAAPTPGAVLLDLYCGCGSFGITLARRVSAVMGIDNNPRSIESALAVAKANQLENCEFVTAAVEAKIGEMLARPEVRTSKEVVAIVDPPRGGLHKGAVYALLGQPRITRLLYVSCCPETLQRDVVMFCMPCKSARRPHTATRTAGQFKTPHEPPKHYVPFKPVKTMALDLFPHTTHVEAVMLLERSLEA